MLVSSTLPTDYWKVSTIDGTVITTATYWANLWKMCVTDSTGVSNCKDFPSMLALDGLHPVALRPCPSLLHGLPAGLPLTQRPPAGPPGRTPPKPGPAVPLSAWRSRGESPVPVARLPRTSVPRGAPDRARNPGAGERGTQTGLGGVGDSQATGMEGSSYVVSRVEDRAVGPPSLGDC